jgi:uncharacterized protein
MLMSVKKLTNPLAKTLGLIGAKIAYPVFFRTRWGIHTFGLRFPIDVLILDERNVVVKTAGNLKPGRIFLWPPRYRNVIELPAGDIEKLGIQTGREMTLVGS